MHGGDHGAPVESHGADPKGISAHTQPSGPEELSDHSAGPSHRDSGTTHANDPFEQGTSPTHPDVTAGHDTNIGYVANAGPSAHAGPEPTTPAQTVLHEFRPFRRG
jgi:hypothetical protein